MDWKEVLKDVFSIAPSVGAAVLAPNPATVLLAVKSIASAFGKDEAEVTPDNVAEWMKDPSALIAWKTAEAEFLDRERERQHEERLEIIRDVQNARSADVAKTQASRGHTG